MIISSIACALLVIAGLFLWFKVRPSDITGVLFKPMIRRAERKRRIHTITGKKPRFIRRQIESAQMMLDSSGMGKQLSTYKWMAVILGVLGFAFGLAIDNVLAAVILAIGLALMPLVVISIRTGEYIRALNSKLETTLGLITNAYIQSGDILSAIKDSLHLVPSPLDEIFKKFFVDINLIDSNVERAIMNIREKIQNRYWKDWCSVLIQCQSDRQLRFALPGIVERLGETRRVQMETDTAIRKHFSDYILTVLIVLGSIPLMGFMMPEWYQMLMSTVPGKITLAVILFAVLSTSIWVSRIHRPVDMGGGKS